ncbi:hypothetical protein METHPM2_380017 [Pseudomonas sp. PM2]
MVGSCDGDERCWRPFVRKPNYVKGFELRSDLGWWVATVPPENPESSYIHIKTCNMPKRWQNGICSR